MCYTNDIIDSLKKFYADNNMNNTYNVPLILKVIDSFGNTFHREQMENVHDGGIMRVYYNEPQYDLRPGDILTLEVEVDPNFNPDEYTVTWGSGKGFSASIPNGTKAVINITDEQVAQQFDVQCRIATNKKWHRMHMGADDFMLVYFRVLPPA